MRQEYVREASPGDTVFTAMTIDNISERKTTGRGPGYFFETLATFTNQHGETLGTQRFKVLKLIPQEQPAAAASEQMKYVHLVNVTPQEPAPLYRA